ncbi:MAG TPA: methylenetetrahydrofolate--tRNA-(uracil(54)-C(5))-methyltransferase (FADH(2)-oxidizing) TrmFO [Candidatus Limnocylindrales bacterium]|nr:methylenetetrahydrofolate--tRNA-(uracil(54)-C(5))-methyltransferase (FADH(2)-oxidizing) TrmFO [Candidatus Limnocylindrales bacterium]
MNKKNIRIVGGGLAGSEAAWQLARRGVECELWEMRPERGTEAHQTSMLAELVCSNSLRDDSEMTAVGVLKRELRAMGSLIMRVADEVRVPAGSALAVDRVLFAEKITAAIQALPQVTIRRGEVTSIPDDGLTILATGPLTSPALSEELGRYVGSRHLYFYDAISPILTAESVDMDVAFRASRYGRGSDDYVNCPMDREQYEKFVADILAAETMPLKSFERCIYFEGCMPIEEMARRGRDTLAFGPMKPVGLENPRTGRRAHAVVQLRQDDVEGRLLSMVGFQTKMTYPEQRRIFRTIPGLERAEFVRLGSLHRNTYIDSPASLTPLLALRARPDVMVAGQLVGVEGYVESTATGLLAGMYAAALARGQQPIAPPPTTAVGSLIAYVTDPQRRDFQPMNANYGLFPPLPRRLHGRDKKEALSRRAAVDLDAWMAAVEADFSPAACAAGPI